MDKETTKEIIAFFVKFVSIPALIAIFIKIAIQIKNKQATIIGVISSLISGLGVAYLMRGLLDSYIHNEGARTLLTAFIAIMADKAAEWIIFKSKVDAFFTSIGEVILSRINKYKK